MSNVWPEHKLILLLFFVPDEKELASMLLDQSLRSHEPVL